MLKVLQNRHLCPKYLITNLQTYQPNYTLSYVLIDGNYLYYIRNMIRNYNSKSQSSKYLVNVTIEKQWPTLYWISAKIPILFLQLITIRGYTIIKFRNLNLFHKTDNKVAIIKGVQYTQNAQQRLKAHTIIICAPVNKIFFCVQF